MDEDNRDAMERGSAIGALYYRRSAVQRKARKRLKSIPLVRFPTPFRGLLCRCESDLPEHKNLWITVLSTVSIAHGEEGGSRGKWRRVRDAEHSRKSKRGEG